LQCTRVLNPCCGQRDIFEQGSCTENVALSSSVTCFSGIRMKSLQILFLFSVCHDFEFVYYFPYTEVCERAEEAAESGLPQTDFLSVEDDCFQTPHCSHMLLQCKSALHSSVPSEWWLGWLLSTQPLLQDLERSCTAQICLSVPSHYWLWLGCSHFL